MSASVPENRVPESSYYNIVKHFATNHFHIYPTSFKCADCININKKPCIIGWFKINNGGKTTVCIFGVLRVQTKTYEYYMVDASIIPKNKNLSMHVKQGEFILVRKPRNIKKFLNTSIQTMQYLITNKSIHRKKEHADAFKLFNETLVVKMQEDVQEMQDVQKN